MIIQSTQVWINDAFQPGQLEIAGGRIEAVLPYGEKPVDQDYQDQWILPGFIDIHTHGWNRCDAGKPTVEAMLRWQKHMPKEGVTSFLATTATQSAAANEAALPILKEAIEAQAAGAEILGINMEGNFISHQFHGAQDLYTIVKPDSQQLLHYQNLAGGHILTVTCAVEFDEITRLSNRGRARHPGFPADTAAPALIRSGRRCAAVRPASLTAATACVHSITEIPAFSVLR